MLFLLVVDSRWCPSMNSTRTDKLQKCSLFGRSNCVSCYSATHVRTIVCKKQKFDNPLFSRTMTDFQHRKYQCFKVEVHFQALQRCFSPHFSLIQNTRSSYQESLTSVIFLIFQNWATSLHFVSVSAKRTCLTLLFSVTEKPIQTKVLALSKPPIEPSS